MNRKSLCILLFLGLETLALAQTAPLATPPTPPFVKRTLPHATWTVNYDYGKDISSTKPRENLTPLEAHINRKLIKLQVIKADAIRREISSWSDDTTSETWIYKNWILLSTPNSQEILVMDRSHMNNILANTYPDYAKTDFPGLDWLSVDTFTSVRSIQGRPCYVFRKSSSHIQTSNPILNNKYSMEIEVSVDGITGLPVEIDSGTVKQTYSYQGSPSNDLELPPQFAAALKRFQDLAGAPYAHTMK